MCDHTQWASYQMYSGSTKNLLPLASPTDRVDASQFRRSSSDAAGLRVPAAMPLLACAGAASSETPARSGVWPGHGHAPLRRLEPAGDLFSDSDDDSELCLDGGFLGSGGVPARPALAPVDLGDGRAEGALVPAGGQTRTTIMIQRIANDLDEAAVGDILNEKGLGQTFTAVYVPRNRKKDTNLAYAFVDFALPEHAALCMQLCENLPFGDTTRICSAAYSKSQGHAFVAGRMSSELTKRQVQQPPAATSAALWKPQTPWVCGPPPGLGFELPLCL